MSDNTEPEEITTEKLFQFLLEDLAAKLNRHVAAFASPVATVEDPENFDVLTSALSTVNHLYRDLKKAELL